MKQLIRYFAKHPTAANIIMIAIILLGLASVSGLNKETFPQLKADKVQVSVPFPGASPSDVEEGICNRLEDATDGIVFLKEQKCTAQDNVGTITLTMQESGKIKQFKEDVQTAIDRVTDFPEGVEDITVRELGRTDAVLIMAIRADLPQSELKGLAEHYRQRLLSNPKIPIVEVIGFSQHQYRVLVKPERLKQYQLSIQDIANLISKQSIDSPAGLLKSEKGLYQIRFENLRRTVQELEDLVILNSANGGEIRLGDIAKVSDTFETPEQYTTLNGKPAGLLMISKNKTDDTLKIYDAVKQFVDDENTKLPESTRLVITRDAASVVADRLHLLLKNGWQGLILATLVLFLFFSWRYTLWVALGLPVSFLGGLMLMSILGVSINMISMVALLMAIGILMDDAIVLSESIEYEYRLGKSPLQAALDGTHNVIRGVLSSFMTSVILFGSLLFLKGGMGQILGVLPVVLLSVLSISLIEAFLILPHHLKQSLEKSAISKPAVWRQYFDKGFEVLRHGVGRLARLAIVGRYFVLGGAIALLIFSIGMMASGVVKFKGFPKIEGNIIQARILLPQGTPFSRTLEVVEVLKKSLDKTVKLLPIEPDGKLVINTQVSYSENKDANETGPHLATITLDVLSTEKRHTSLAELQDKWREQTPVMADVISIQFKEPSFGPSGKSISIRLQGNDLQQISQASWELQHWLKAYDGVSNVMDDLRPGKTQFSLSLLPGALAAGIDSQSFSAQLRASYQGVKVSDIYRGRENYEVNVQLDSAPENALEDLEQLTLFSKTGESMPLSAVARINEQREYSRLTRINHQRTVTVVGDIDSSVANTGQVLQHTKEKFLNQLQKKYPKLVIGLEGEVKNDKETSGSVLTGFILGIIGVYLLLSLQFENYREPIMVLINIPLALIGVIWGHYFMGLDMSLPSMIGFVALAGVVVNDSILMVEYVKRHSAKGLSMHDAAELAVKDRFRAVLLTSVTTVAGMIPILSETSPQAQILVPLVASVVFGMMAATVLILIVLPASYAILADLGVARLGSKESNKKYSHSV
ncbi:MAG: efflux RND transporter permease subunit [Thiotrichaceae bacterium]|nr:efflux RND transporter permease subunit [Thiotrichaceae bacterium]